MNSQTTAKLFPKRILMFAPTNGWDTGRGSQQGTTNQTIQKNIINYFDKCIFQYGQIQFATWPGRSKLWQVARWEQPERRCVRCFQVRADTTQHTSSGGERAKQVHPVWACICLEERSEEAYVQFHIAQSSVERGNFRKQDNQSKATSRSKNLWTTITCEKKIWRQTSMAKLQLSQSTKKEQ